MEKSKKAGKTEPMKILAFGASLRTGSYNKSLARFASTLLSAHPGIDSEYVDFRDFEMPVFDEDLEEKIGMPDGAKKLVEKLKNADALVISAPEYNGGMSGALKNAIDWVSRADENPLDSKPMLLIGASPGALGAIRSLWHTRVPFEAMGTYLYPEMFGLSKAHQAFDESGKMIDPKNESRLNDLLKDYIQYARKLAASA